MKAFRYAHEGQGSNYYQDIFEFKGSLTRESNERGTVHIKNYKRAQAIFVIQNSSARTLIDVVEPFYQGQPGGKQRGWGTDPGTVNTKGIFGQSINYPYSLAIFAGGVNSQNNERLVTVFFSDLNTFKQWKAFVGN